MPISGHRLVYISQGIFALNLTVPAKQYNVIDSCVAEIILDITFVRTFIEQKKQEKGALLARSSYNITLLKDNFMY